MQPISVSYLGGCPGCGGDISIQRLESGLFCPRCKTKQPPVHQVEWIFRRFGINPWGAQRLWARRFLRGESFMMVAPTGSGKTTAAMALALLKRSLILVPTSTLAYQIQTKLESVAPEKSILGIHSLVPKSKRPSIQELINADVIVSTSASLIKHAEMLRDLRVEAVFVDDVDGFLRRSKAIDIVLNMLGIDQSQLQRAQELLKLMRSGSDFERFQELRSQVRLHGKQIIVSGATQTARRTERVKLLSLLLGFDLGRRIASLRNIEDFMIHPSKPIPEFLVEIINQLGSGGLVYVHGSQNAQQLAEYLNTSGISAAAYVRASRKIFEAFQSGKLEILVGTLSSRSSLVRGIDLPEAVRYAIFAEVPKFLVRTDLEGFTPNRMILVLAHLLKFLDGDGKLECIKLIGKLRKISRISRRDLELIKSQDIAQGFLGYARQAMLQSLEFVKRALEDPHLSQHSNLTQHGLIFPDGFSYIQASGRTSRLTLGGMTKGISLVIVDDPKAARMLMEQLSGLDLEFKQLKSINDPELKRALDEVDCTRKLKQGAHLEAKLRLVLVESPTKARTISGFFGKPARRNLGPLTLSEVMLPGELLMVTATGGHITELDIASPGLGARFRRKLELKFKLLKPELVQKLRQLAQDVDEVIIATDPDAEGEKIAWDLRYLLAPMNPRILRARYHEVTKRAIQEALSSPQEFDPRLFRAQLVRTIQDAWVGLPLSVRLQLEFGSSSNLDLESMLESERESLDRAKLEYQSLIQQLAKTKSQISEAKSSLKKLRELKAEQDSADLKLRHEELRYKHLVQEKKSLEQQALQLRSGMRKLRSEIQDLKLMLKSKQFSAGRVQTPVLEWIAERVQEYRKPMGIGIQLEISDGRSIWLRIPRDKLKLEFRNLRDLKEKLRELLLDSQLIVEIREMDPEKLNPPPPFSTDTLLVDAVRALGSSSDQIMQLAQQLFESGLITYHRTDSTRVSSLGINIARQYLQKCGLLEDFQPRSWALQEGAHECIRPTKPLDAMELEMMMRSGLIQVGFKLSRSHLELYDLIFKRFISSQMNPCKLSRVELRYKLPALEFESEPRIYYTQVIQSGFDRVSPIKLAHPPIPAGCYQIKQLMQARWIRVALYTESELIQRMKQTNIGRPSTYALTLQKLKQRGYVFPLRSGRLMVTEIGLRVLKYLKSRFPQLISEQRTAQVLELMDSLELGKIEIEQAIRSLMEELNQIYGRDKICQIVLDRGLDYVNRNWERLLNLASSTS